MAKKTQDGNPDEPGQDVISSDDTAPAEETAPAGEAESEKAEGPETAEETGAPATASDESPEEPESEAAPLEKLEPEVAPMARTIHRIAFETPVGEETDDPRLTNLPAGCDHRHVADAWGVLHFERVTAPEGYPQPGTWRRVA